MLTLEMLEKMLLAAAVELEEKSKMLLPFLHLYHINLKTVMHRARFRIPCAPCYSQSLLHSIYCYTTICVICEV